MRCPAVACVSKLTRIMRPSNYQLQLGFKLTAFIRLSSCKRKYRSFAAAQSARGPLLSLRVTPPMASKRPLSTSPILHQDKKDKKLKGFPETGSNLEDKVVVKPDDIHCIKNNPPKIEAMTVQQLRTTLRNLGVPAKGRKCHLVAALKSFMDKHLDGKQYPQINHVSTFTSNLLGAQCGFEGESCQEAEEIISLKDAEQISPLKRTESISAESCAQTMNTVSEVSQLKRRVKKSLAHDETGKSDIETVNIENKISSRTDGVLVGKSSRTWEKVHSVIDSDAGATSLGTLPQAEPWTVLAHKKPQKGWIPYNPKTMRPHTPQGTEFVKLMSWNVNGLRALLKLEGFSALELAQRENFDVLCLQETKLKEEDVESIKQCLIDGYENSFWTCSHSKLGYSGTAIISRVCTSFCHQRILHFNSYTLHYIKPLSVKYGLGMSDHDTEGRLVTAEFDSFYLINGYVPNSGDGLKRLSYRITQWDPSLSNFMKELEKSKPVILTGDLNCAHHEIDIYNPAGNKRSAGFTIEERQSFEANFLSRGFVDTFRRQHPNAVAYTYWGYRHGGRKTNKGWRLDYFLVSESIAGNVHDSYIVPDVTGSDHCPIGLVLKL